MEFSRSEHWEMFSSRSLLQEIFNPGIKPRSPVLKADSLPAEPQGKPKNTEWVAYFLPTPVFLPGESHGRGEPGGLPSMGSQRVGHDWSDFAAAAAAYLFFSGSSRPKNRTAVSCIAGGFFTNWEAQPPSKTNSNQLERSVHGGYFLSGGPDLLRKRS